MTFEYFIAENILKLKTVLVLNQYSFDFTISAIEYFRIVVLVDNCVFKKKSVNACAVDYTNVYFKKSISGKIFREGI